MEWQKIISRPLSIIIENSLATRAEDTIHIPQQ
jgi:hypothetical protein